MGQALSRFVKGLVENFGSEEVALEVEEYFGNHPIAGTSRSVEQGVENIRLNAAWLARDANSIKNYLAAPP